MKFLVDTYPGRTLTHKGQNYLYFGGTSYLGIQQDPDFMALVLKSLRRFGSNYGASRRSNVQFALYEQAEAYISSWVGSASALTLSSGYLAGQLVAHHFKNKAHSLFYAPNSHSALYTSGAKPYTTYTTLGIALQEHLEKKNAEIPVVFIDSIDFSGCNYPNFEIIRTLPLESCILVVDDSHGIGIVEENGSGVYRTLKSLPCRELVLCASLGKAIGIQAGMVAGERSRLDQMKASDFFGGASPAAPFYLSHFMQAESIYARKREDLKKNLAFFKKLVRNEDLLNSMPDYPVLGYSNPKLTEYFLQQHIVVTDFRYPSEDTYATNRIVITAAHLRDDLSRLAKAVNSFPGSQLLNP